MPILKINTCSPTWVTAMDYSPHHGNKIRGRDKANVACIMLIYNPE